MTAERIVAFLQALHAKHIKVKANGWVESSCVLAPSTHSSKQDSNPSFGIAINDHARSHFSCFTCNSGNLESLIQTLEMYGRGKGFDFKTARAILNEEEALPILPAFGEGAAPEKPFEEWPGYWLSSFVSASAYPAAVEYLAGRGFDPTLIEKFNLRFDTKRNMLVCPYWTVYQKFAGARGRSILPGTVGPSKHFDYTWNHVNNSRLTWYNEMALNNPGPVVVVEGQADLWRVTEVWPKAVANLTAKPTWAKLAKLAESERVIQIPDRDEAGARSVALYAELCNKAEVKHKVLWLDEGVKDAAECHPQYLMDKIKELL